MLLKRGGIIPNNPQLLQELAMPTYEVDDKGRKCLESKKQIRDRLGKSPDMAFMFTGCKKFNQNISKWNVSKVTDMSYMFYSCENFNQDLSGWNVSNVEDMGCMFYGCKSFNQDISGLDVSKVRRRVYMFDKCPIKDEYKPKFK